MAKIIIFSAPSGAGKSTVINYLLKNNPNLEFAISATSRSVRGEEKHGEHYYFITSDEFKSRIGNNEFVEWEEVYTNTYYGTLKSEVDRIGNKNKTIVFDVDVEGGINIKAMYPEALAIFISPPSIEILRERLENRKTDTPAAINERVEKARSEMGRADKFDYVLLNDKLEDTLAEISKVIDIYLEK